MAFIKNDNNSSFSDNHLLAEYKSKQDDRCLALLYQRYMELIFGVCLKYLKDTELAKDAVMDIYLSLGKKLQKHDIDNFKSWLHTVAKNHCLMFLRSPRNLATSEFKTDFVQSAENPHLNSELLLKEENFNKLEECLKFLTDEQKESIKLFYLQKKCYKEIAVIKGFDWNKVRSYIQNGKRNLKSCLESKGLYTAE